jgi:threonine-phosphate decarboxylase
LLARRAMFLAIKELMRLLQLANVDLERLWSHGGPPSENGRPILDFSTNLNPFGPPASVLRALREGLADIARYPDTDSLMLAEALAKHRFGVDPNQIVIGNGVNECIHAIARNRPPGVVAIVQPTYTEYHRACVNAGHQVEHWVPEGDDFQPAPFDPGGAQMVWLCNPNNPTGRLWRQDQLLSWVKTYPSVDFVVDESFLPFRRDEFRYSLIGHVNRFDNLIVLRSLTKLFTLPGLRLGYLVANPDRASALRSDQPWWPIGVLAQLAGIAALKDEPFVRKTQAWLKPERNLLLYKLDAFSDHLHAVLSETNFVLVRLQRISAEMLRYQLLRHGICIRLATNRFVGLEGEYVRLAVRTRKENEQLLTALQIVLKKS